VNEPIPRLSKLSRSDLPTQYAEPLPSHRQRASLRMELPSVRTSQVHPNQNKRRRTNVTLTDEEIHNHPDWMLLALRDDFFRVGYLSWVRRIEKELKKRGHTEIPELR